MQNSILVYTYFKWLDKRPEQYSNGIPLPEQFYQSSGSEQSKESDVYEVFLQQRVVVYHTWCKKVRKGPHPMTVYHVGYSHVPIKKYTILYS